MWLILTISFCIVYLKDKRQLSSEEYEEIITKSNKNNSIKDFKEESKKLSSAYGITETHADCFLCNYEDRYICNEYNGVCKSLAKCKEIYGKERTINETK